jgi:glyoxylase I family protein
VIAGARYDHTNLIARDWRRLAAFYQELFGCTLVPPERDYAGPVLEAGTGVRGATLKGVHLRLPGHGSDGPTLEIYSYDVPAAHAEVLAAGGRAVGEIVTTTPGPGIQITWCYLTDPEGNVIELQSTKRQ